jgi:hypothetical protein
MKEVPTEAVLSWFGYPRLVPALAYEHADGAIRF